MSQNAKIAFLARLLTCLQHRQCQKKQERNQQITRNVNMQKQENSMLFKEDFCLLLLILLATGSSLESGKTDNKIS